jgi:hypothetical protein
LVSAGAAMSVRIPSFRDEETSRLDQTDELLTGSCLAGFVVRLTFAL